MVSSTRLPRQRSNNAHQGWISLFIGAFALLPASGWSNDADTLATLSPTQSIQRNFVEGWREGKIEAGFLLNKNLHRFELDASVAGATVTLTGTVEDDVEKELARQIALGVDGVKEVVNLIAVDPQYQYFKKRLHQEPAFSQRFEDATINASVKARFLDNDHLKQLDIRVETEQGKVLIYGNVRNNTERDLAGQIAANVDGVQQVDNRLRLGIDPDYEEDLTVSQTVQLQ